MIQNRKHPAFTQDGPDREDQGNQYIANMRNGAMAGFKYFDLRGLRSLAITVRGKARGRMLIKNKPEGESLSEISIQPSAGWTRFEAPMSVPDGVQALFFVYEGRGAIDFLDFTLISEK
ncbi:MAG TPA: hypothetical protein DCM45_05595 [Clostridiales bacterium]|nr:hypothetical protein [Clostridiales bacterium]